MEWRLRDAKNQFSKLVQKARVEGPQVVTVRGEGTAVVLTAADYDTLRARRSTICSRDRVGTTRSSRRSPPVQKLGAAMWPSDLPRRHQCDFRSAAEHTTGDNWLRGVDPFSVHLSVITLGEVTRGIALKQLTDLRTATHLGEWLQNCATATAIVFYPFLIRSPSSEVAS
jgi:prevent-host-death family protein